MADIEQLTELEQDILENLTGPLPAKALRIIDAQAAAIERVRKILESEPRLVGSPEARLARDVQEALGG